MNNIISAIKSASLGKRKAKNVAPYYNNSTKTAKKIRFLLINHKYNPSHIHETRINEHGKHRIITSSPFYPDQIIHWAFMNILSPIFLKSMYHYNLATIPGRGGIMGRKSLFYWLTHDHKHTKYTLKTDIHHFYQSINHKILKEKLLCRFKDKEVLRVLFAIIDCYYPGLPLGLYTSQWLANFFLEKEDHKIKEKYHASYYLRYMDDQVLLGPNKKKLHKICRRMCKDMNRIGLVIKPTWQVWRTKSRPIDFLGYKFYPDHVTIRGRDYLSIMRSIRKASKSGYLSPHRARSLISYNGFFVYTNSYHLRQIIKNKYGITISLLKDAIKNGGIYFTRRRSKSKA